MEVWRKRGVSEGGVGENIDKKMDGVFRPEGGGVHDMDKREALVRRALIVDVE